MRQQPEKETIPSATPPLPRVIALELTRSCVLACRHCRASATKSGPDSRELSTYEYIRLIDSIAAFSTPILVLTGGEPMLRPDLYDIARYASERGLPVALAPCGLLIDDASAAQIARSGVRMVSISLDGADAGTHDAFRGLAGAFRHALNGIEALKRAGIAFQINTTVCTHNAHQIERIWKLSAQLGASMFNPFFLVATGRGSAISGLQLGAREYESTLHELAKQGADADAAPLPLRVTCAPHYQRILQEADGTPPPSHSGGCLGGKSFAFVSHRGIVQICGFLEVQCGDLREDDFDFEKIWRHSGIFRRIRDVDSYHGRCGRCEYRYICGGCRARAFAESGDYLGEEPRCHYRPRHGTVRNNNSAADETEQPHPRAAGKSGSAHPAQTHPPRSRADDERRRILAIVQSDLRITPRPFDRAAEKLAMPADRFLDRLRELDGTLIKRIGPIFEPAALGYFSTLAAACVPEDRVDEVAAIVSEYTEVTHNYRRNHNFNLWFTLITAPKERQDEILEELKARTGMDVFLNMPARKVYKIRACFALDESNGHVTTENNSAGGIPPRSECQNVDIGEEDRKLIRLVQAGIPVQTRPVLPAAEAMGWDEERVTARLRTWVEAGVIRRFGAVLHHTEAGFRANGMCVFDVPDSGIDRAGRLLAGFPAVTHCYNRHVPPQWNGRLFAMVHAAQKEDIRDFARRIAARTGARGFEILFSTREYKKTPMRYFSELTSPSSPSPSDAR